MEVRAARSDDLDPIVRLTRSRRRQLARWAPTYFHPAVGADEAHARWLGLLVESADHRTFVVVDEAGVAGFFALVPQPDHLWVDDLCLAPDRRWADALPAVAEVVEAPWVTCAATGDRDLARALDERGLVLRSRYFARSLGDVTGVAAEPAGELPDHVVHAPAHTFGGRPFAPDLPGALVVVTPNGHLIGSPSATPPIYDPGGPTGVVDQLYGPDRGPLVDAAMSAAAGRGDAQLVVVGDGGDDELTAALATRGFAEVVVLYGTAVPPVE